MKKGPTISDVAREAGVVRSTVSHVINGSRTVLPETRAAVLAAVEKLGYRPSSIARELSRGKSMTVAVVTKDITSAYHASIIRGVEIGLSQSQFRPLIASVVAHEKAQPVLDLIMDRNADAIIVISEHVDEQVLLKFVEHIPIVAVSRAIRGIENQSISVDNFKGGYDSTQHLISLGHTRIAHITSSLDDAGANLRCEGYKQALQDAGIVFNPMLIVQAGWLESDGYNAMQRLLAYTSDFSAVFVASDAIAYGVMLALYQHNITIPDDVSIVAFDDLTYSEYTIPPLTTVRQPMNEMGIAAAQMAIKLIDGEPVEPITMPVELIIRDSTAVFRPNAR